MNELVIQKLESLKDSLLMDERVVRLNQLDEKMNNDESVISLVIKKNNDNDYLLEMIKYFGEESIEASNARKALQASKEALYLHPLVKKYNKQYQKVRMLYIELNRILFSGLNINCHHY